jgi:hypothetical protein
MGSNKKVGLVSVKIFRLVLCPATDVQILEDFCYAKGQAGDDQIDAN